MINEKMRASVLILTETKIDSTYTNDQFKMSNYRIYRIDRKKGGGGVLAKVKAGIAVKRLKLPQTYNTMEVIALDVALSGGNCVVLCTYRPTRSASGELLDVVYKLDNHTLM